MLVVMRMNASPDEIEGVVSQVQSHGLKASPIAGAQRTAVGITGNVGVVEPGLFESLPGVLEVIQVSHPYKLVSREFRAENTVLEIGGVESVRDELAAGHRAGLGVPLRPVRAHPAAARAFAHAVVRSPVTVDVQVDLEPRDVRHSGRLVAR